MKNLKTLVCSLGLVIIFSCSKDTLNSNEQTVFLSENEKQILYKSEHFLNIHDLNYDLLREITSSLLNNPELVEEIISHGLSNDEILYEFDFEKELYEYDQKITHSINNLVLQIPKLEKIETKSLVDGASKFSKRKFYPELKTITVVKQVAASNGSSSNDNQSNSDQTQDSKDKKDCQDQFEKDMQYIHGQYDSAVMGAGIAAGTGIIQKNPVGVGIGAVVSGWAVGRAVYKTAVAIDDYNDCMGGKDEGEELPQKAPEDEGPNN